MKTSGVSCETKFGILVLLGHPTHHCKTSRNDNPQLKAAALPSTSNLLLQVNLEGNPFLCSCSSLNLHSFLLEHYPSVDKFKNITITCNVEEEVVEKYLYELKEVEFCEPIPVLLISLVFGFFLLLVFFVLFLQLFYGDIIVIWVFSRPWGKVFFSEDLVDREKPFDAFLSYAHQANKTYTILIKQN